MQITVLNFCCIIAVPYSKELITLKAILLQLWILETVVTYVVDISDIFHSRTP